MQSLTPTRLRRTALLLLLSVWFQSGVALGSAFSGVESGFAVLCRNGVLVTVDSADGERRVSVNLPCVLCAHSDNDSALITESVGLGGVSLLSREAVVRHAGTVMPVTRILPPARAPPTLG